MRIPTQTLICIQMAATSLKGFSYGAESAQSRSTKETFNKDLNKGKLPLLSL